MAVMFLGAIVSTGKRRVRCRRYQTTRMNHLVADNAVQAYGKEGSWDVNALTSFLGFVEAQWLLGGFMPTGPMPNNSQTQSMGPASCRFMEDPWMVKFEGFSSGDFLGSHPVPFAF